MSWQSLTICALVGFVVGFYVDHIFGVFDWIVDFWKRNRP